MRRENSRSTRIDEGVLRRSQRIKPISINNQWPLVRFVERAHKRLQPPGTTEARSAGNTSGWLKILDQLARRFEPEFPPAIARQRYGHIAGFVTRHRFENALRHS